MKSALWIDWFQPVGLEKRGLKNSMFLKIFPVVSNSQKLLV